MVFDAKQNMHMFILSSHLARPRFIVRSSQSPLAWTTAADQRSARNRLPPSRGFLSHFSLGLTPVRRASILHEKPSIVPPKFPSLKAPSKSQCREIDV